MADRRRPPSRRAKATFKAERPETDFVVLGMAVVNGMAMVHDGSDVWIQSLPADNIEPCPCDWPEVGEHYRLKEGFSAPADR
jgi:hypothetical protein